MMIDHSLHSKDDIDYVTRKEEEKELLSIEIVLM